MADTRSDSKPARRPGEDSETRRKRKQERYSRPTVPGIGDFGDVLRHDSQDAGLRELVQFFRKTPPPPTNYMSIPDDGASGDSSPEEEDRWGRFKTKVLRRRGKTRKGAKKKPRPPLIMLPDSAVAARTTDGHRYIAISIPTEYSPLGPLAASQYPVYDSVEAAFHREVDSRFGTWKGGAPANRLVTVLKTVPEERRESTQSTSRPSTASEQPDQATVPSNPSMRKRPHSVCLSPSQEQRYSPSKVRDLGKVRSVDDMRQISRYWEPVAVPQNMRGGDIWMPPRATTRTAEPSSHDMPADAAAGDADVAESSTSHPRETPVITLTLPSRKSSRRGAGLEPARRETAGSLTGSDEQGSSPSTSGADSGGGGQPRGSFAASIETTNSSPQLLKAQTAIVVKPSSGADLEPLDLNDPAGPGEEAGGPAHAPPEGPIFPRVERSRSRRQRRHGDMEALRARPEHEGKGKERASQASGFMPGMRAALPRILPTAILGHHHHDRRRVDDYDDDDGVSSASPFSSPATSSDAARGEDHGLRRAPSLASASQRGRGQREARFIARALAEKRETLESLPREELVERYEALREQRLYERERRLRRLERSHDTWVRSVPGLLQELYALLREQHRLLEGARPPSPHHAAAMPAGSSGPRHRHHHQPRQRSRSVDVSSGSRSSGLGSVPPATRRSRSLHGHSGTRLGHQSSSLSLHAG